MSNAGFESGLTDWNMFPGAEITTLDVFSGAYALSLSTARSGVKQQFSVSAGDTYTLSAYGKTTGSSQSSNITLRFYDGQWNQLDSATLQVTSQIWAKYSVDVIAPDGAVRGILAARKWDNTGITVLDDLGVNVTPSLGPTQDDELLNNPGDDGSSDSLGNELLSNPSFEAGFDNWSISNGPGAITTATTIDGNQALRLSTQRTGVSQKIDVSAGETYRFSGFAKTNSTGWNVVGINFWDSDWNRLEKHSQQIDTTNWAEYQGDYTAPTGAVRATVWAHKGKGEGAIYLDDFSFKTLTDSIQVDDSASDNPGDEGASDSPREDNASGSPGDDGASNNLGDELLSNPSFEAGFDNWSISNGPGAITTATTIDGNQALRLSTQRTGVSQKIDISAGETYRFSGFAKTNSTGWNVVGINFWDSDWNRLEKHSQQIDTTNWAEYQGDYTAPTGAVRATVWAHKGKGEGAVYLDDFSFKILANATEEEFDQPLPDIIQGNSDRIEAETATLGGHAEIANEHSGFSGDGFVDGFSQIGAFSTFTVNVAEAGLYNSTLRYANGSSDGSTLSIYVNDVDVTQTQLPTTTSWNSWGNKTELLSLEQGENTISYRYDSDDTGWVNLDYLWLSKSVNNGAVGTPIANDETSVEIEKFVQLPNDSTDKPARMIGMTTQGQRLFVFEERDGHIYEIKESESGARTTSLFFDVGEAVFFNTGRNLNIASLAHGGLKGVAFHPEFISNGKFYTSMMEDRPNNASQFTYLSDVPNPIQADSVVVEWTYDFQLNQVKTNSYREVLRIGMPVYDHPIKEIAFNRFAQSGDEDYGLLYITHGDGSVTSATAGGGLNQDALGKILRINPLQNGSSPYSVSNNNPFVGDNSMLDEVYSLGHRNPHTISFNQDAQGTSHILVGEAGRDNIEEINLIIPGGNYGWSEREGTFVHRQAGGGIIEGLEPLPEDDADNGYVYPAAQWGHDGSIGAGFVGQAVAGGYVGLPGSALAGQFLFGDFAKSGQLYYSPFSQLLNAVTILDPNDSSRDNPGELTQATIGKVDILFDHDNNDSTTALLRTNMKDVLDDEPTYIGGNRADIRFGQGPDREIYVLNKRNGYVYLVNSSVV